MKLAKDFIDIGVQTNRRDEMLDFWQQEVGLPYEELLKVGGGTHQHRLGMNGSVFKLNHVRDPLPEGPPTGYSRLLIARPDISEPRQLEDPDGNAVMLVPQGHRGITHIGMEMEVASLSASQNFYRHVVEAEPVDDTTFKWATTLFFLKENPERAFADEMRGVGYRYLTVQVWKVDEEHQRVLERGGDEGRAPATLGKVARISFIRDPDGNWIEISQRASLTGDLNS
ncbi:MAG: VOC family protein [Pseudomonadales bacterium]|nr:VOC family protein [Pseudomonadales bacterium]